MNPWIKDEERFGRERWRRFVGDVTREPTIPMLLASFALISLALLAGLRGPAIALPAAAGLMVLGTAMLDGTFDAAVFGRLFMGIPGHGSLAQHDAQAVHVIDKMVGGSFHKDRRRAAEPAYRVTARVIQRAFCLYLCLHLPPPASLVAAGGFVWSLLVCWNDQWYYPALRSKAPATPQPYPKGLQALLYSVCGREQTQIQYRAWAWRLGLAGPVVAALLTYYLIRHAS